MNYCIAGYFGGLGDALQFSTLPEELTKLGHDVYLWNGATFRNDEIRDLVWGTNPFIKGVKDGDWNLGDYPGIVYQNRHNDFIKNWESTFGVEPINSYPKIYYQPKINPTDVGVIDFSSVTTTYDYQELTRRVELITSQYKIPFITPQFKNKFRNTDACKIDTQSVNSLFEYYDLICSCKVYISVFSGSSVLASAARVHNPNLQQYCFVPTEFGHYLTDYHFILPKIQYLQL